MKSSAACTCVKFSAPLQGAWVPCHVLRDTVLGLFVGGSGRRSAASFHNVNPDPRRTPVFGPPRTQNPDFYVLCPEFLRWLARILVPDFSPEFFPEFFCGFSRSRSHFETRKKIREKIREPVRPLVWDGVRASQDWSPKLLRFLALQSGGPLRRLVFVHAEAAHTLQSDFLLGGRGGVS